MGGAPVPPVLSRVSINRTGNPDLVSFLCFVVPLVQCLSFVNKIKVESFCALFGDSEGKLQHLFFPGYQRCAGLYVWAK